MNKKSIYISPDCQVVRISASGSLLTASNPVPGTTVTDDPAGEGVGGLSRRRNPRAWDDEEEEEEDEYWSSHY